MFTVLFTTPDGAETCLAWNQQDGQEAATLQAARKAFFGRKGRIDYSQLTATCQGATLRVHRAGGNRTSQEQPSVAQTGPARTQTAATPAACPGSSVPGK